jgi:hypothetical protein
MRTALRGFFRPVNGHSAGYLIRAPNGIRTYRADLLEILSNSIFEVLVLINFSSRTVWCSRSDSALVRSILGKVGMLPNGERGHAGLRASGSPQDDLPALAATLVLLVCS